MRLIDADALIERIKYSFYDNERVRIDMVTGTFLTEYCSPTVDAEPVRHGRWVMSTEVDESWYNIRMVTRCSECKFPVHIKSGKLYMNYCPNCGAKTDLEESDAPDR